MTRTILKHHDRTSIVGSNIEIMYRRSNHGPESVLVIPFEVFAGEIAMAVSEQLARESREARRREAAWNGSFVLGVNPKKGGAP